MGAPRHRFLIGTYTKAGSQGIYACDIDAGTGELGGPALAAAAPNPTFLALSPDQGLVYAVCAGPSWASSFRIDRATGTLVPVQLGGPISGPTPCHIAVDATGTVAVAANYHLALAAAIPTGRNGALGAPRVVAHTGRGSHPTRQDSAHVHSANFSPDGRFVIVCDLGLDRIYSYLLDREAVALVPAAVPFVEAAPGSGPRHFAFGPRGTVGYATNELANTVVAYSYDAPTGRLTPLQTVSVLPEGYAGEATAAEVRIHPNGRFLYASSRGPDTLAVFAIDADSGRLEPVEAVPCGGKGPRNFALSPDGAWLVCAHQDSDTLCSFRVDGATGRLSRIAGTRSVSLPVCVAFLG
jgi:6-phosphogluconolactonase